MNGAAIFDLWDKNLYTYAMRTYISAMVVLAIVLAAHIFGLDGLYYRIDSYDIFMHILGGVGIGLFAAALLRSYRSGMYFSKKNVVYMVVIVGIVWELFEIYYQITGHPLWTELYYIDTVKDLIDDTIGGTFIAWVLGRGKSERSRSSKIATGQ